MKVKLKKKKEPRHAAVNDHTSSEPLYMKPLEQNDRTLNRDYSVYNVFVNTCSINPFIKLYFGATAK